MQDILAIKPPTGVRQLRHFLGMVQYYCDLWARRSDMLAPLTSLVGECGQTKSTKAKGTKKVPWHWDKVHQRSFDQNRTEQLRKLGKLLSYYLDKFNHNGVFIRHKQKMQSSIAVGTVE